MKLLPYLLMLFVLTSCNFSADQNSSESKETEALVENSEDKNAPDINRIKEKLCNDYPKDLVLSYNTDAIKLEIDPIDNGAGGILSCKLKLFYGEKEYEYWEGSISAWINQMADPFKQYDTNRNPSIFHNVDELGDKAVFIANTYELQILKDGIIYSIVPPNRGRTTNSGKSNKEIAIEVANHFNI